jgi:hypothetical protein
MCRTALFADRHWWRIIYIYISFYGAVIPQILRTLYVSMVRMRWLRTGSSNSAGFKVLTAVVWDITSLSPLKANQRSGGICRFHFQGRIISKRYVPPKRQLTFNGLHDVISHKVESSHSVINCHIFMKNANIELFLETCISYFPSICI